MNRRAAISVDLEAVAHNLARVRVIAPNSKIMAIVKANAYGHGATRVASALAGADALGVATVGEALELQESGIEKPLVVLEGFLTPAELVTASQHHFFLFVHHLFQIDIIEKTPLPNPVFVWIKVDTGMNRLGIAPVEVEAAIRRLKNCPQVEKIIGMATHFASADEGASLQTPAQLQLFHQVSQALQGAEHTLANSAAILAWPESHAAWVRPGLVLYGVSPFVDKTAADFDLKPAMSFCSTLIATQDIHPGEYVGYGGTWQAKEHHKIGIVACGYADGYPRHAASGTPVWVEGVCVPLIGRVSMDMMAVDLTQCPSAGIGSSVELWGEKNPIEAVAKSARTIPYELLCRMSNAKTAKP